MKLLLSLLITIVCCSAIAQANELSIHTVSSLQKLTAKEKGVLQDFVAQPVRLMATRGEWESFQIVITAGKQTVEVSCEASDIVRENQDVIPAASLASYWENFVFVSVPSGNRDMQPLWWPDALVPTNLQPKKLIPPAKSEVLWCTVRVPANVVAGDYLGFVNLHVGQKAFPVPFELKIVPVSMPQPAMRANVALYYAILRDWYQKNLSLVFDNKLKKQYYDFLLDYRLNAYDLPVAWDDPQAATYLQDARVRSVRLPPLDNKTDFDKALKALRETKTLEKAYYYWIDEPAPETFPSVKETTEKLHAIDPGIKHCVTAHPNESLKDSVDIWCPNIGDFFGIGHLDIDMLANERSKGRETWWYTMVEPKYPYPTWLLDDSALSIRCYAPFMARDGINGFVYSMVHGWGPKPLENLQSYAGTNGDGTLLYPAELVGGSGPMPSIRLMLLRDAIEDWELLRVFPSGRDTYPDDILWSRDRLSSIAPTAYWEISRGAYESFHKSLRQVASKQSDSSKREYPLCGYDNTPGVQVPRATALPEIDGKLETEIWKEETKIGELGHPSGEQLEKTDFLCLHDEENIYAAFKAEAKTFEKDWCAAELANGALTERYRFVVTSKGTGVVERHTREGKFRVEGVTWKFAAKKEEGIYTVEMQIPLSIFDSKDYMRANALRRIGDPNSAYIVRLAQDAGDITLMHYLQLQN